MPGLPYEHFCPYESRWEWLAQYPEYTAHKEFGVCWLGSIGMAVHALMEPDGWTLADVVARIAQKVYQLPLRSEEFGPWYDERNATSYKASRTGDIFRDLPYPNCRCIDAVLRIEEFPLFFEPCYFEGGTPEAIISEYEKMLDASYTVMPTLKVWTSSKPRLHLGYHMIYLGVVDCERGLVQVSDPNDQKPTTMELDQFAKWLARPFVLPEKKMAHFDGQAYRLRRLHPNETPSSIVP